MRILIFICGVLFFAGLFAKFIPVEHLAGDIMSPVMSETEVEQNPPIKIAPISSQNSAFSLKFKDDKVEALPKRAVPDQSLRNLEVPRLIGIVKIGAQREAVLQLKDDPPQRLKRGQSFAGWKLSNIGYDNCELTRGEITRLLYLYRGRDEGQGER